MKIISINIKTILIYSCIFMFSCLLTTNAIAQDTEYWFVAPDASFLHGNGCDRPTFIMITTGSEPAKVTISMPKNSGFPDQTKDIPANSSWQYYFGPSYTYNVDVVENSHAKAGQVTDKGIHIKSATGPISVYYQVNGTCSKDIFTLKGSKALGDNFYIPFQTSLNRQGYADAFQQIHVVATKDGTKVNIAPKARVVAPGNVITNYTNAEHQVTLNRGQTYLIRSATTNGDQLCGTRVWTQDDEHPIAITSADDPVAHSSAHDIVGDQLVPVSNLGTNYVAIRGFTSTACNDRVYVVATENGTTVKFNGVQSPTTLAAGQSLEYILNDAEPKPAVYIETSNPSYCFQVSGVGSELGGALLPSMYSINSRRIIFDKGTQGGEHYLFLMVRKGSEDGFTIKGSDGVEKVIPSNIFYDVPQLENQWKYCNYKITSVIPNGASSVYNSKGAFSLGYFNGPGGTALYGYLSSFGQLSFPEITYKCLDDNVVLDAGYAKTYKWWKGTLSEEPADGSPLVLSTSSTLTVLANQTGQYSVRVNQDPFKVVATTKVVNDTYEAAVTAPKYAKKGSSQSLSATVTRPAGKTFAWTINGGTPASATTASTNTVWNTTGKYDVKLTIKNTDYHCNDTLIQRQVLVYDIKDDNVSIPKNRTATIDVLANDDFSAFDPSKLTIAIISAPTYGTASVASKKVEYTQTHGYTTNQDQLVYRVLYNGETVDQATVYIKTNSWLKVVKEGTNDDLAEPTTPGKFTFKYVDSGFKFDKAVKIHYEIGGTAVCGDDYIAPANFDCGTKKGFVMLGINAESVTLSITPKDNYKVEGNDRKIELTILSVEVP